MFKWLRDLFKEKRQYFIVTSTWVMKDGSTMILNRKCSASKGYDINHKTLILHEAHVTYLKLSKLWDKVDYMKKFEIIPDKDRENATKN